MKKLLAAFVLACMTIAAVAQNSILRPRVEIAELEDDSCSLEVFYMNDELPRVYYLSVGNLGIGNHVIQIVFDPIVELFIPIGNTLDEAIATMEQLKAFYKEPKKSTMEITGIFSAAYPNDNIVPVTVTSRRFIFTKQLEFSIPTEGMVRATRIPRSDFSSLLLSVKMYRGIHPNE